MKRVLSLLLALALLLPLAACGSPDAETPDTDSSVPATQAPETEPAPLLIDENALLLTIKDPKWEDMGSYYQLTDVAYCTNVVCPQYQYMNIYAPAAYFSGESVHGYTADTAPVVLENNCSGWNSSTPGGANTTYLEAGFVFVSCGARSRNAGEYGKSPCAAVDQKSAVRTLRLNADVIPGDMERIISEGTSGAGQMSSILGASGNMEEYYPYLYESGAPGVLYDEATDSYISTIDDHIYASMCYCPIADINNADLAYAWCRFDCSDTGISDKGKSTDFTEFQLALQNDLAIAFCRYINSLGIRDEDGTVLTFDLRADGTPDPRSGSYYQKTLDNLSDALNAFIADCTDESGSFYYKESAGGMGGFGGFGGAGRGSDSKESTAAEYTSVADFLASYMDTKNWLVQEADGTWKVTDIAGFIDGTGLERNKDIPGFDTFDRSAENNAFGTAEEKAVHYSASVAAVLEENYQRYAAMEGFDATVVDEYIQEANREDIIQQVYLMNATHIMLNVAAGTEEADFARYWRTRNGTADQHTSFSVAYNICMSALMAGCDGADYSLVWEMNHGNQEGTSTGTFVEWVHSICGGA